MMECCDVKQRDFETLVSKKFKINSLLFFKIIFDALPNIQTSFYHPLGYVDYLSSLHVGMSERKGQDQDGGSVEYVTRYCQCRPSSGCC